MIHSPARGIIRASWTEMEKVLEGKKRPSFLGSAVFAEWIKAQFYSSKIDDEVPQAKDLVPDTTRILNVVSEFYGISEADLYLSRRDYSSSVSSIMGRVEQRMSEDKKLKDNINQIRAIIKKSQGQI